MSSDNQPSDNPHQGSPLDIDESEIREIHALSSPPSRARRRENWDTTSSVLSSRLSIGSELSAEGFTTMSGEFNAMVVAGSNILQNNSNDDNNSRSPVEGPNLGRIGEEFEENNPLAIIQDMNPMASPRRAAGQMALVGGGEVEEVSVQQVKKEEVESKISAWQTAKIAKINNRFKREDCVINGVENAEVEKANAWLKKVERKLDAQRAKAIEKTQNDVAKARRKAEEKRATAESKRGTNVAKVLELANLMRAIGKTPTRRSFF